jgi:hypothetical protein
MLVGSIRLKIVSAYVQRWHLLDQFDQTRRLRRSQRYPNLVRRSGLQRGRSWIGASSPAGSSRADAGRPDGAADGDAVPRASPDGRPEASPAGMVWVNTGSKVYVREADDPRNK